MPQPTRPSQAERTARLLLHAIPEDIRKSLDGAELNDRVVEMARLSAQAQDGALSAPLRAAARNRARAIAEAQPRAATLRQHQALIAKASATRDLRQAEAIRRQAERLLEEEHPVAPRRAAGMGQLADEAAARAVAKARQRRPAAKAAHLPVVVYGQNRRPLGTVARSAIVAKASGEKVPMQPVFDENGNLIGIVDPEQIQPVAGSGGKQDAAAAPAGQAPAQPAAPAQAAPVAKGDAALVAQVLKSLGPKYIAVYDMFGGSPVGIVKKKHVTATPAGRVAKAAASPHTANVYDARRRRVGTARLADITDLATLRAPRARGRSGR
jgi:hypothetical protein